MYREVEGDLFSGDYPAIGHGVNCKGFMGAGIAKAFKDKFPQNYAKYRNLCRAGELLPGQTFPVWENDVWIYNIASQFNPGPDARLAWLLRGVQSATDHAELLGTPEIALPQIGCGIGGLRWDIVQNVLRRHAKTAKTDLTIVILP